MQSVKYFLRDECGSQTIEFLLWVPIFVALLIIVMDATTLYITQTEMENVARDTARSIVKGGITPDQAADQARAAMSLRDFPYSVAATFDANTGADVTIAVQTEDIAILGPLQPLIIGGAKIAARVIMRPDPTVTYGVVGGGGNNGGGNNGGGNNGGGN